MKRFFHNIKLWSITCIMIFTLFACEQHDYIDENTITGNIAPQAFWEIGSSAITAGNEMPFTIQYYSTNEELDHSEVWYSITETIEKTVSTPWLSTFTYSYNAINTEMKRIPELIKTYPHTMAVWSDSINAYTFKNTFPVSGTLKKFTWTNPETFDSVRMEKYFGTGFMENFKDSLFSLMKYADFQKMYLGMGLLDNFINYTDSTLDENSNSYVYHFPKDANGNTPVPEEIKTLYDNITFEQLIENTTNANYDVSYSRKYQLEAVMRVYDKKGEYGTTLTKTIEIN